MRFLLAVTCGAYDGPFQALVEITPEWKKFILERRELFQLVDSRTEDLVSFRFWDASPVFYEDVELTMLTEEQMTAFETDELLLVGEDFKIEKEQVITECDTLVLNNQGVYWVSYPKHSDTRLETTRIDYDVLNGDG